MSKKAPPSSTNKVAEIAPANGKSFFCSYAAAITKSNAPKLGSPSPGAAGIATLHIKSANRPPVDEKKSSSIANGNGATADDTKRTPTMRTPPVRHLGITVMSPGVLRIDCFDSIDRNPFPQTHSYSSQSLPAVVCLEENGGNRIYVAALPKWWEPKDGLRNDRARPYINQASEMQGADLANGNTDSTKFAVVYVPRPIEAKGTNEWLGYIRFFSLMNNL